MKLFDLNILECLNDGLGNDGIYLDTEVTEQGNDPSDDLMCVQVSPGKAYVKGYDVEVDVANTIDVEKPRDTESVSNSNIPFSRIIPAVTIGRGGSVIHGNWLI